VCDTCAKIKASLPDGLGDDQTLVEIQRRLAARDRRQLEHDEAVDTKKRRATNRRAVERRWNKAAA
jgi:hypothetical protein